MIQKGGLPAITLVLFCSVVVRKYESNIVKYMLGIAGLYRSYMVGELMPKINILFRHINSLSHRIWYILRG